MNEQVSNSGLAERVVEFLNEVLATDRPALAALIANRVPCNEALANHPTVQVSAQHGGFHIGMLGLLNGLCGIREDGQGLIAAVFDGNGREPGNLTHFAINDFPPIENPCTEHDWVGHKNPNTPDGPGEYIEYCDRCGIENTED